jgi:hypothetical protein
MSAPPPERLLKRIRAEFLEMPGLCLTSEQVQRLCGVERTICQLVLDSLVDAKVPVLEGERCLRTVDRRSDFSATASQRRA